MDSSQRELLVWRIASATVPFRHQNNDYVLVAPTPLDRLRAQEVYLQTYATAVDEGQYSDEDLVAFLLENGLWSAAEDKGIEKLHKDEEDLKVQLFKAVFQQSIREVSRKKLAILRQRREALLTRRHAYDHLGAAGSAQLAKTRALVQYRVRSGESSPRFTSHVPPSLLESALAAHVANRVDETSLRELAHTEPWRSTWACKREPAIFGKAAIELTDEQKQLISWSQLYENVGDHPECPADEILNDDDMLDGWLIVQRREREKASKLSRAESVLNDEKLKDANEVFLVANTPEDIEFVQGLNDEHGAAIARARLAAVEQQGSLAETELPDVKMRLQMARNRGK